MEFVKKLLKVVYSISLWIIMLIYIVVRKDMYVSNNITTMDNIVLILFVVFTILPLFSEIDFMGVKLKREIEKNKIETEKELLQIRAEISNNSIHNSNVIYNYANLPDSTLKNMEKEYKSTTNTYNNIDVDEDTILCFKIRQRIEILLKQIAQKHGLVEKNYTIIPLLRILVNKEIVSDKLYNVLIEIIIICNKSIHGEEISRNHSDFIKNTYMQVLFELEKVNS